MEEFFWRDFLWRTISAPNDFKMAAVGEWDPKAFFIVTAVFASVHMQMWITAFVWGAMIAHASRADKKPRRVHHCPRRYQFAAGYLCPVYARLGVLVMTFPSPVRYHYPLADADG